MDEGDQIGASGPNWTEESLIRPNRNCLIFRKIKFLQQILENKLYYSYKIIIYSHALHGFVISNYKDSMTIRNKGRDLELVKFLTTFTAIELSNNKFYGEIPKSVGKLKALLVLNL